MGQLQLRELQLSNNYIQINQLQLQALTVRPITVTKISNTITFLLELVTAVLALDAASTAFIVGNFNRD